MKIYSDDGKLFDSIDECNSYEAHLALKKQKEEIERKRREEKRISQIKDIDTAVSHINKLIEDFMENNSNDNIYLTLNNNKLYIKVINKKNDFTELINNINKMCL